MTTSVCPSASKQRHLKSCEQIFMTFSRNADRQAVCFYLWFSFVVVMVTFLPCLLSWGHFAQEEVGQKGKSKGEEE